MAPNESSPRESVRAIVVKDDQLLVMKRNKFGQQFYSLIGGGIDEGETPEAALVREVQEEASLLIDHLKLVAIQEGAGFGKQYIYTAQYISGEPSLDAASEEAASQAAGQNLYEPGWLPLADVAAANILPSELKPFLLTGLSDGFPDDVQTLTVNA
jgi:ADP-ribose pyrophosphatase YjhB (NUDIX family)